jgi:hypothetical protein
MRSQPTSPAAFRRWAPVIIAVAVAGSMGILLIVFAGGSATTSRIPAAPLGSAAPTATLNKVQLGNAMLATQQALARQDGPYKTVLPMTPAPTPASCPMVTQSSIGPGDGELGVATANIVTNAATIAPSASDPLEYVIYAGASRDKPQQGVLVVFSQPGDPCAHSGPTSLNTYDTPYQRGALTITAIHVGSVSFSIADGGNGQFNYVTGKFS